MIKKKPYKEGNEFEWKQIEGKTTGKASFQGFPFKRVKQFTSPMSYKSNGEKALCQIRGCYEVGVWLTEHKGKTILLCFEHGEES